MRRLLVLLLVALPLTAAAAEPKIDRIAATVNNGNISVSFHLADAFDTPEFDQALRSGLPTGFTYHVELVRRHRNWFDNTVAGLQIEVICTYNSVTKEYLLNYRRDRKLVRSETFVDLQSLRDAMTTIVEPELFPVGDRNPFKLYVRARATVARGFLLYLIPRDISTDWRAAKVRRAVPNGHGSR